jgi:TPR repeat protein
LRHGWGITKDEKKAFHLLRQACDETLASTQGQSSLDIQQSRGTVKLSLAQKKEMTRDLSLGLFEIANCFLEGSGTKKSPEVALEYLKLAANMGDLASQEREL